MSTNDGDQKRGTGRAALLFVIGIAALIWGIVGHEPCLIVIGIVLAAAGLVLMGFLSGILKGPKSE